MPTLRGVGWSLRVPYCGRADIPTQ